MRLTPSYLERSPATGSARVSGNDTGMQVAVIGAGVMGLATGWALKRRGIEATVYEQFEVGNPRGSSHGRSRIFRLAYAEDHYVRLAQEAMGLWRELEAESGETLLELYGLVEIVQTLEESTAHTLERCGVSWERLDAAEAERRFPIRVPGRLLRRRSAAKRGSSAPTARWPHSREASTCASGRACARTSWTRTSSSSRPEAG